MKCFSGSMVTKSLNTIEKKKKENTKIDASIIKSKIKFR